MAMSGPQHAKHAKDLLWEAEHCKNPAEKAVLLANGQLHATLALLAAVVHGSAMSEQDRRWWQNHGVAP